MKAKKGARQVPDKTAKSSLFGGTTPNDLASPAWNAVFNNVHSSSAVDHPVNPPQAPADKIDEPSEE